MKKLFTILLVILSVQDIQAQCDCMGDNYLPRNFNKDIYFIAAPKIIRNDKDSLRDYAVEITATNDTLYTFRNLDPNAEKIKTETLSQKHSRNKIQTVYYKDGNYETGIIGPYFGRTSRKGIWRLYNSKKELIAFGRYKRSVHDKNFRDTPEKKTNPDEKKGKWKYLGPDGKLRKIVRYKGNRTKKTNIISPSHH